MHTDIISEPIAMQFSTQVIDALAHFCAVAPEKVRPEQWLIEFGMDSVRTLDLIIHLEDHFEIQIEDEELASLTTVQDVVDLVQRHSLVLA